MNFFFPSHSPRLHAHDVRPRYQIEKRSEQVRRHFFCHPTSLWLVHLPEQRARALIFFYFFFSSRPHSPLRGIAKVRENGTHARSSYLDRRRRESPDQRAARARTLNVK